MATIVSSVEVARVAPDVFAYLDDLVAPRRVAGGDPGREITENEPGSSFAFSGIDGPIRVIGRGRVEARGERSSRITVELDFAGHGLGRLMVPLARCQARAQVPRDQQRLKAVLEGAGSS
jgi:hypothetical protein